MNKITIFSILLSLCFIILSIFIGKELSNQVIFIFEEPFQLLGDSIRKLSLLGGMGNIFAIFLYLAISLIPILILIYIIKRKKIVKIDYIFTPLLSLLLFFIMYYMINPNLLIELLPPVLALQVIEGNLTALRIFRVGLVFTLDIFLIIYLFVRFYVCQKTSIYKLIQIILYMIAFSTVFNTFYIQLSNLLRNFSINPYDNFQSIMNFSFQLVSTFIIVYLIGHFQKLVRYLESNEIDSQLIDLSIKISNFAVVSVIVILLNLLINNVYNMVFSKQMQDIKFILSIPMLELMIVMVMLLITEYIKRTYIIHEENALTI
ncbi:MAG: hypothetical protein CVV57_08750 [Tenericutes bacterium HGW-Tenericutes-2]|jgi:hypothetical protein|nr:MAG: hypothetical protein CVV57_08750 [Tenericutes bacterium HGW-Tenericutes-2]